MTLKVSIWQFLTTFTQLTARLKFFMLVLDIKEGLVEYATVVVKKEVILTYVIALK